MKKSCACGTVYAVPTVHGAALITEGVIDDAARSAFTEGQCHALALAVHEATGWPIVAVVAAHDWAITNDLARHIDPDTHVMALPGLRDFADHVLVRHPDGHLVDISGKVTPEDAFVDHEAGDVYPDATWGLTPEDASPENISEMLDGWYTRLVAVDPHDVSGIYDRTMAIEAARTLVAPLLASIGETVPTP